MKGIDYTGQTTAVQAKALKDSGYDFVCRYLVPDRMAWKRLTRAEADILTSAGLHIVSVFEAAANNAAKGAAQGTLDGKDAFAEAKIVSQPIGSTIYFAIDYDAQPKEYDTIELYLKAAQTQIPGYNVGVYGSYAICEEMFRRGIKYCWQTYAWSAGKKSAHANIYQYKNDIRDCGITGDANASYGNEGFWNLNTKKEVYPMKYYKVLSLPPALFTHVVELDPMSLKSSLTNTSSKNISKNFKNFINSNFFGKSTIGWLISEGKVLNERHEEKVWKGNPKGTLIVYKNGMVEVGLKYDSDMVEIAQDIWFCCQGFNLFPLDIAKEGFTGPFADVARRCTAVSIGYNNAKNKVIIAVRTLSDAARTQKTMANLGCQGAAIRLDSGESANLYINGKGIFATGRSLTNIIYWES